MIRAKMTCIDFSGGLDFSLSRGEERLMYAGRTIFAQLMDLFPTRRFHTCVRRYQGDLRIRRFTCLDQFRVMAFAQLTYRESLRDIELA